MSIIFQSSRAADDPQTHVLVIGVGAYSHIRNGGAFDPNVPLTAGLRQLTSSVPSAESFANWLISNLQNQDAPLGTIEIALSPGLYDNGSGTTQPVDTADLAGIKKTFNAWNARCDRSEKNVAIFYFCGHGLDDNNKMMLLPEDFGASPNQLGDEMIDFTTTWYAMGSCKAKCQLYLLDACREAPLELVRGKVVPRPLKSTINMIFPPRDAYILNSAPQGQKAHAPNNSVSFFTSALTRCFEKLGARNRNGAVWEVSTDSLTSAVVMKMQRSVASNTAPVFCTRGGMSNFSTIVHRIAHPAEVMAEVDCNPMAALPYAEFAIERNGIELMHRGRSTESWQRELDAGVYDLRASFPGGEYGNKDLPNEIIYPPLAHLTFTI